MISRDILDEDRIEKIREALQMAVRDILRNKGARISDIKVTSDSGGEPVIVIRVTYTRPFKPRLANELTYEARNRLHNIGETGYPLFRYMIADKENRAS